MRDEDKKYVWWGLLGIGVAAFFYFLSQQNQKAGTTPFAGNIQTPVLVEQPLNTTNGASPTADTSLSNQPNIIGESPNSAIPNGTNPAGVSANFTETPGTWNGQLNITQPTSPTNNVNWAAFSAGPSYSNQSTP